MAQISREGEQPVKQAEFYLNRQYTIGEIDRRLSGSFVEHLGRCLYNGLYEPGHPRADRQGFREDVKELIRELGVTCIRYPGGNFVSGYNWRDGVGPKDERPIRRELAWNTLETNEVGTDEFAAYCRELGVELIMACNLGTGTPKEAGELADYCLGHGETALSAQRQRNGAEKPHDIRLWCLGNEMDGAWQINALSAGDYARKAREAAKIIRWIDPKAETVACGSCTDEAGHLTYGEWDRIVLETAYDEIDFLSLHRYYNYHEGKHLFYPMEENVTDIPYFFRDLSNYIETVVSACDFVRGKLRREKRIQISFDEWGLVALTGAIPGGVKQTYHAASFSAMDAVIYGGLICTLLNHADRVKAACQSLLVNEGGMITTVPGGEAFRQATFYPFRDMARLARGVSLRAAGASPAKPTDHHGEQDTLIMNASYDEQRRQLAVMIANVDMEEDCRVTLRLAEFGALSRPVWTELYTEDPEARNVPGDTARVTPRVLPAPGPEGDRLTLTIKKHSWNTLVFQTA